MIDFFDPNDLVVGADADYFTIAITIKGIYYSSLIDKSLLMR